MTESASQVLKLADEIKGRGLGPLAAFLLRANLPLATIYAHVFMGLEPIGGLFGLKTAAIYETLNDRDALMELIDRLEKDSDGE